MTDSAEPFAWSDSDRVSRAPKNLRAATGATWKPNSKAQITALGTYTVPEVIYEGNRGGGKTITLLMTFLAHVGKGYGPDWRGVIFRIKRDALKDIINQSKKWFWLVYPGAIFNETSYTWKFPDGEMLTFAHFAVEDDYWGWHGQELPFIAWEELTSWPDDSCFKIMMSCNRSSNPRVPRMIRATTNPFGIGKHWVKTRYNLPLMRWHLQENLVDEEGGSVPNRLAIHFKMEDNIDLMKADPDYPGKIRGSAKNKEMLKAWMDGDWDARAGGMFDDLFNDDVHLVEPFLIPRSWRLDRAFDWGSAAPYAYGLFAESDGTPYTTMRGEVVPTIRGDVFMIQEDYGWNGTPNKGSKLNPEQQATRFKQLEQTWGVHGLVKPGAAGVDIWSKARGPAIYQTYLKKGIKFIMAYVAAGSRASGLQEIRTRLFNADPRDEDDNPLPREYPGVFFFKTNCIHLYRTIIGAAPDEKNPDDLDPKYEDHMIDMLRYRLFTKRPTTTKRDFSGRAVH